MSPVVWPWVTIEPAASLKPLARKCPIVATRRRGGDSLPTWPIMNCIIGRPTLSMW
jgi:hypothetical protein